MLSFLIIHTNPTVSKAIELILEKYNAKKETCLGYDRSEPIHYAQHQKPDIVFMERRYSVNETESVMYRFKYISPNSKFYLLANNLLDKHTLKTAIIERFEDVISNCEVHQCVNNLVNDIYDAIEQSCIASKHEHLETYLKKLTKAEKDIYMDLRNGLNAKAIATDREIAIDTANKHIKHILKKLNVHSRKDLLN